VTKGPFDPQAFLRAVAPHVLAELRPPAELAIFTTNPDLIGGYVEGAVRSLLRRYLFPLRVCGGSVIDQQNIPGATDLPQLDTIVWTPAPVPAIFEAGEFALVPRSSSLGILEIKSSAYDLDLLERRLNPDLVRRVAADPMPEEQVSLGPFLPALGVVCVRKHDQPQGGRLAALRMEGRVVVLFEERAPNDFQAQSLDVYKLLNFLAALRLRASLREGRVNINTDLLAKR
jgi:hypothetical protein